MSVPIRCRIARRIAWSEMLRNGWWVGVLIPRRATKVFRLQRQSSSLTSPSLSRWNHLESQLLTARSASRPSTCSRPGVTLARLAGGECRIALASWVVTTPVHNYLWVTKGNHVEGSSGGVS